MMRFGGATIGVAALVFLTSAVAFGVAVVDAVRVQDVQALSVPPSQPEEAAPLKESQVGVQVAQGPERSFRADAYPLVTNDEILEAVNRDLFLSDRTPLLDRYLLPNERMGSATGSRNDRRQREPNVRIVGTAISGDRAVALVQVDDEAPFAVLLGEDVDGYLVAAVDAEGVTLTGEGGEFTYPVVEPQTARNSNSRDRNSRNQAASEDVARALTERVQQMLQGMGRGQGQMGRGGSAPTDISFQLQERLQQLQSGGQLPGNVIIRTRPGGGGGGGSLP